MLPEFCGRHLLQIGSWGGSGELLAKSEMLHRAVLGTVPGLVAQTLIEPDRLPLAAKSVAAVLLAHVLAFARSPPAPFREVTAGLPGAGRLPCRAGPLKSEEPKPPDFSHGLRRDARPCFVAAAQGAV